MTVIAANADRYPVSAQCEILGVARSTYYSMRSRTAAPGPPDPVEPAVLAAHEADLPNVVAGEFGGHAPRTHVCSDLTYVRVGGGWNYVCLLVDLSNREIVGHSAGPRKDAALVRAAFATLEFPISDIEVLHTDRGSEFDNAKIDEMLDVFGIERSLSRKGCPYDNAVDESTNKILKAELVYREMFGTTRELQVKLADYVHWYNNFRMHSTLGYMTPVEFRKAGLVLPKSSKKM